MFNNTVSRFVPRTLAAMFVVMACLAMATNVQAEIILADVDHHWGFEETSGTVADDSIGTADGTLMGGSTIIDWSTDSQVGTGAVDFAAATGVVDISSISGTYLNDFSVSMWVKAETVGNGCTSGRFMEDRSGGGTNEWLWYILADGSTNMGVTGPGSATHPGVAGSVAFGGTYHHVTFTISEADGDGNVLINQYVNGALAGAAVTSSSPTAGSDFMGIGNNKDRLRTFDGRIDEVVIFNRELTGTEISDFYDAGGDVANIIPEPCMLQLLIIGGLLVLGWRRLR